VALSLFAREEEAPTTGFVVPVVRADEGGKGPSNSSISGGRVFSLPHVPRDVCFIFHRAAGQRVRFSFSVADRGRLLSFSRAIPTGKGRKDDVLVLSFYLASCRFSHSTRDNASWMQAHVVCPYLSFPLSFLLSFLLAGHRKPIYLGFIWTDLLFASRIVPRNCCLYSLLFILNSRLK